MRHQIIESRDHFREVQVAWQRLYDSAGTDNVFLSGQWIANWLEHFQDRVSLHIVIIWDQDMMVAALPGYLTSPVLRSYGTRSLRFIGDDCLADYMDILIEDNNTAAMDYLVGYLSSTIAVNVSFARIKSDSGSHKLLMRSLATHGYHVHETLNCENPFVSITGPWDEYYSERPKKLRQEIRTTLNKLNRQGKVSCKKIAPANIGDAIKILGEFHKARQALKAGDSILERAEVCRFIHDGASELSGNPFIELSTLQLDDIDISIVCTLRSCKKSFYWIPSFDSNYRNYSLGKLHIKMLLEEAHQQGDREFDFLIGAEKYKLQWSSGAKQIKSVFASQWLAWIWFYRIRVQARAGVARCLKKYPILQKVRVQLSKYRNVLKIFER